MNEFKTWEQLTRREQLISMISDTYKDLNGFRPYFGESGSMTDDQLQGWYDDLCKEIRQQIEADRIEEERLRQEELAHERAVKQALTPFSGFTIGMVWKSNNKSYSPFEDSQEYHESFA